MVAPKTFWYQASAACPSLTTRYGVTALARFGM